MRLIDADELIAEISNPKYPYTYDAERIFKRMIDNAPTVDAVPVMRCKDCKYMHSEMEFCKSCIEVKTRSGDICGYPSEAVTAEKQRHIRRSAEYYLQNKRCGWRSVSLDVFEIMTDFLEDCM